MSGLETLPPDQRAVLQLILVQGRGYADLAATLRLDDAAVRRRAHAGAEALGLPPADELDADTRGRIVDYLLGQQDDGERIVTFAELGSSPAACRWAQELRARLAGVASAELPEVPASATAAVTNGSGAPAIAPTPAAIATAPAPTQAAAAPALPRAAPAAPRAAPPSPPATVGPSAAAAGPNGPRPSRLGGAILIGGAAVLAIVLAIVLIGGDDSPKPSGSTSAAQTPTSAQTQTSTNAAARQAAARTVGGAVLRATSSGGSAFGAALVQQTRDGRRLMAVEVARLPGNGAQDIYAIWLQGATGNKFLGFVPNQVRANGTFTVSSPLARGLDLSAYSTVLVTSEGTTAVPTTPGTAVVSGPLRLAG
ncbi:MAG: RNA polymerase sigma factor [Conexibacter sp.]